MSKGGRRDARLNLAALILFLGAGLICYRLFDLQVLQSGRFQKMAEEQRLLFSDLQPLRGCILDRDGEILAISKEAYSVYATPYLVEDVARAAAELSSVLEVPRKDIEEKLRSPGGFVYLQRKVSGEVAERIEALRLAGIGLEKESKRYYPQGELAPQVVGYVGTDNVGLAGLELQYEALLSGEPGEAEMEVDPRGDPIPGVTKVTKEPLDGDDLQLTLDSEIQFKLQEELARAVGENGALSGWGLVMDCRSGEILAMASHPGFDANQFPCVDASLQRNRVATDAFEPGSVLKVLTAMAALEKKAVYPGSIINIPASLKIGSYDFKDDHPMPKSDMTFTEVIAYSSNIGTIKTAMAVGKEGMAEFMARAGLGKRTGLDFPGEAQGMLPTAEGWSPTTLPTVAIGQGISVTSLQLAVLMALVADGGVRVTPHLLLRTVHPDGSEEEYQLPEGERVISPETAASLRQILGEVVRMGTGTRAAMTLYNCGGKTGTAMKPDPRGGYRDAYVATFAGFAPLEDPRLVVVINLDEPDTIYGGVAAAPCFSRVTEFALQHLGVPPSREKVNTRDRVVSP